MAWKGAGLTERWYQTGTLPGRGMRAWESTMEVDAANYKPGFRRSGRLGGAVGDEVGDGEVASDLRVKIWAMPVVGREAEMHWAGVLGRGVVGEEVLRRGCDALHGLAWGDGWAGVRAAVRCSGRGAVCDRVDPGWNGAFAIALAVAIFWAAVTAWAHSCLVPG